MWACLIAGLLWIIVGLRDIFKPHIFNMSPRVMSKLDISLEFAAAAAFLVAAASFYFSRRGLDDGKREE